MMTRWKATLRRVGVFRAGLLLLLAITLVAPATRELHLLNTKLLFRLRGDKTYAQAQLGGGAAFFIPSIEFTEGYRHECLTASTSGPDAFLLAWHLDNHYTAFPPAPAWQDHPLGDWAALELASHIGSRLWCESRHPVSQPAVSFRDRRPRETIDHALELIALAQRAHPDNGGLWLAEAAMRFCQGDDRAGLGALQLAAAKPAWDHQRRVFFTLMRDRLLAEGLAMFDASLGARYKANSDIGAFGAMQYSQLGLARLTARAVRQGDGEQVVSLLSLLRSLQRGRWPGDWPMNLFSSPIDRYDETGLPEAMAQAMGRTLPPTTAPSRSETQPAASDCEARQRAEDEIVEAYLSTHLDRELASDLIGERKLWRDGQSARCDRHSHADNAIVRAALVSSLTGTGGVLVFGFALAASVCELLFMLPQRRRESGVQCFCSSGFWTGLIPVFALMTGLLFLGIDAVFHSFDPGVAAEKPWLTPGQHNACGALIFSIAWLMARTSLLETVPPLGRAPWLGACYVYLALLILTAHYRSETIAAIAASGLG